VNGRDRLGYLGKDGKIILKKKNAMSSYGLLPSESGYGLLATSEEHDDLHIPQQAVD
jgi:hypothetical protein